MNTNILFWSYLALILVEIKNVSDESCRENQNEHMFNFFFFRKSCLLSMWKNTVVSDSLTDDNMAHASFQILSLSLFLPIPLSTYP